MGVEIVGIDNGSINPGSVDRSTNKEVVRVLPMSMARPKDIMTTFNYLSEGNIEKDLLQLWFTHSAWIVHSTGLNSEGDKLNHLMLPGGQIKQETIAKAARREVWEELHIPHIRFSDDQEVLAQRKYSFGAAEHVRTEFTVEAQVPPFITAANANPYDNIEHIVLLNPRELNELFTTEQFRNVPLIDSLNANPPDTIAVDQDQNQDLKDNAMLASLEGEISIRRRVFERVMFNKLQGTGEPEQIEEFIHEQLNGLHLDSEFQINMLNQQFLLFLERESDLDFNEISAALQVATEEVFLENSLTYLENSGPQAAYLLGQILMDYSTLTPYEMELIKETAPELFNFYASIADGFATDLTDPQWFPQARETVKRMRSIKAKADELKTKEDRDEYSERMAAFESSFFSRMGISDKKELASYSERFDNFLSSLQRTFAKIADRQTASGIFSNKLFTKTSSLEELLYVSLGLSPYRDDEDFDMNSPKDAVPRWQALRKIVGTQQMKPIEGIYGEVVGRSIYRLRQAFESAVIPESTIDIDSTPFDMEVTRLRNSGEGTSIDVRKVPLLFTFAEKPHESIVRKVIERADLKNSDRAEKIDDVLRFAVIADTDKVEDENVSTADKKTKSRVGRECIKQLLVSILSNLENNSSQIDIRKVKTSGAMYVESLIPGQQVCILEEVEAELSRARLGKESKLQIEMERHIGSRASLSKIPWSWLKFVIDVDGVPCELQMYPSVDDYKLKLKDDERYNIDRLQTVPGENRFPVIDTLLREEHMRNVILRNGNGNGKNGH